DPKDPEDPNAPDNPDDPNAPEVPEVPETPGVTPPAGAGDTPDDSGGPTAPDLSAPSSGGGGGVPNMGGGGSGGGTAPLTEEQKKAAAAAKEKADAEAKAKAEAEAKELAKQQREQFVTSSGVSGGWRNADETALTELKTKVGTVANDDGKLAQAHNKSQGIDVGWPGFGLIGMMGLTDAHNSARDGIAAYITAAKKQIGEGWTSQLHQGAEVIKKANEKSTVKES
ncbi:hypothetical protein ACIBI2_44675, partial [Streptosporangium canum]